VLSQESRNLRKRGLCPLFLCNNADSIDVAIGILGRRNNMSGNHEKLAQLKRQLGSIKPMIPGSLSEQWNVCGTKGCKCKGPQNPQRHGPYYQLSFSIKGKSSSLFVKKEQVDEVRLRIKRHREFKELVSQVIEASVEQAREYGFKRS
jgi:hypothetical protein